MSRQQFIRKVSAVMVYLSSAAAIGLGDRVDLYEYRDITAFVGNALGEFHLGDKSAKCKGKNLCSEQLSSYLTEKYQLPAKGALPAWRALDGQDSHVLFVGDPAGETIRFDERFRKLNLDYQKRFISGIYLEDNCISFTADLREGLPRILRLYSGDGIAALFGDSNGPYALEYRGRKGGAIYSRQLVRYLKEVFSRPDERGVFLYARKAENGITISDCESTLLSDGRVLLPVDLGSPEDCFVSLLPKGNLYISSHALRALGSHAALYCNGKGLLALKSTAGVRRLGIQQYPLARYASCDLARVLKEWYADAKKLYLCPSGDLYILCRTPQALGALPSPNQFHPLADTTASGRPNARQTLSLGRR